MMEKILIITVNTRFITCWYIVINCSVKCNSISSSSRQMDKWINIDRIADGLIIVLHFIFQSFLKWTEQRIFNSLSLTFFYFSLSLSLSLLIHIDFWLMFSMLIREVVWFEWFIISRPRASTVQFGLFKCIETELSATFFNILNFSVNLFWWICNWKYNVILDVEKY